MLLAVLRRFRVLKLDDLAASHLLYTVLPMLRVERVVAIRIVVIRMLRSCGLPLGSRFEERLRMWRMLRKLNVAHRVIVARARMAPAFDPAIMEEASMVMMPRLMKIGLVGLALLLFCRVRVTASR